MPTSSAISPCATSCAATRATARYAALKRQVVERHPQDRLAYIEGEEDYVVGLEARAVAWARGRA